MRCSNLEKYIVLFYNRISGDEIKTISDIPEETLLFLSAFDYEDLIIPFATEDIRSGFSREQIGIKYGVNAHFGRKIGRKIGVYKKKDRSLETG